VGARRTRTYSITTLMGRYAQSLQPEPLGHAARTTDSQTIDLQTTLGNRKPTTDNRQQTTDKDLQTTLG
jgi:hypothetical protein